MLSEQHRYYLKSIAFYGLPLLPALYYMWRVWDAITGLQDFFVSLGAVFIIYCIYLGTASFFLDWIHIREAAEMIHSAHEEAQQRSEDEQRIIVPHSARPPRGGWSRWRRR